jgi:hypothetical protein
MAQVLTGLFGADLAPGGIVSRDQVTGADADTVTRVAHQTVRGFGGNGFAKDVTVLFIVNVDGGTSLNGSCDGHRIQCWGWVLVTVVQSRGLTHEQGVARFANLDGWSVVAFVRLWLLHSPLDHSASAIESGQKPPFTNLDELVRLLFDALLFSLPKSKLKQYFSAWPEDRHHVPMDGSFSDFHVCYLGCGFGLGFGLGSGSALAKQDEKQ